MARPRGGLGRGLSALIPGAGAEGSELLQVSVEDIAPNPRQPRQRIDGDALQELAESLRQHGLLQPLVLAPTGLPDGPRYHVVAGERRWAAARMAGLRRVPAVVRGATPQQLLELALVENLQRQDLNPLEEARAFRQLVVEFGLTHEALAERVGRSRVAITNALRLLALPAQVLQALAAGEIGEGHARSLLALSDEGRQLGALRAVLADKLSVRATEQLVRRLSGEARPARASALPAAQRALEDRLRRALGTRVTLALRRGGGTITIHYASEDQLQEIYERIVRSADEEP